MNLVKRNLYNVVLVMDLSRIDSLALLTEIVRAFVARGIPVRFGFVPVLGESSEVSTMVAKVLWYLVDSVGRAGSMKFLDLVRLSISLARNDRSHLQFSSSTLLHRSSRMSRPAGPTLSSPLKLFSNPEEEHSHLSTISKRCTTTRSMAQSPARPK